MPFFLFNNKLDNLATYMIYSPTVEVVTRWGARGCDGEFRLYQKPKNYFP